MKKIKNPLVIVANGEFPTHPKPLTILNQSNFIISCDGATDTLISKGYIPNLIIGDLDSISDINKIKYKNIIIKLSDQSKNDLRKALDYVNNTNINNISIIGASGKREDHTIGNIFSLINYKNLIIKLYTDFGVFTCIHESKKIESFKGQKISLFSPDSNIKINSKHLKYNINQKGLSNLYEGTLNESYGDFFELEISHGSVILFKKFNEL